jgi:two-component system response regulator VicR
MGGAIIADDTSLENLRMTSSATPIKVLVVDDDEPLCKLCALTMREQGLTALTAFNGETALELFAAHQPEVIILDVAMPGMSGFDVAAEIRRLEPPGRHTIIIILTAYARSYFASKNFEADIDSFLTKPVLPQDLIAHVSSLIT